MKKFLKEFVMRFLARKLHPLELQNERQEAMLRILADVNFQTRAVLKRTQNQPIHVVFVCHMPALWSTFESVYRAASNDPGFIVSVVTLPYRHNTLPEGHYKDDGMQEFLKAQEVAAVKGYDSESKRWLTPISLSPDYVFFQTPYDLFPTVWSVEQVSMLARVAYIPYGITIFGNDVTSVAHPLNFFRVASLTFADSTFGRNHIVDQFKSQPWFDDRSVVVSGSPKLDYLTKTQPTAKVWRRGARPNLKRILWTPRWRTSENNCHFFDYKDYFIEFCRRHSEVDFVFRPHPLCLQNFLQTGELTNAELEQMEQSYANSPNLAIDRAGEYQDTFLTSDILVSDISSLLLEYFATGKPIIYTHRVDAFNELGRKLSEGFYWVKNVAELDQTLSMLISGKDPLTAKRQELIKELLFFPDGGAGLRIKETLRTNFNALAAPTCST